ncbi:hypothetical protein Tco_1297768, partial [Tanacetum coccineum]
ITSITVNGMNAYELKGNFIDDLHKNAFGGTNREDAVEHIEYFLKIVNPIDLPNVNRDKLRVVVFPISLVGDAWRCELKEKALRNKAIMEGLIDEDEYEHEDEERCELFDNHELSVCTVRRFEMIKYSFGDDEEYVAVKEDEYDDLMSTSKDA